MARRSSRSRRVLVRLAVPVTVLAASIGTTAVAAPAEAASPACLQQKTRTMSLRAVANEYEYVTYITSSGQVSTTKPYFYRKNVDLGRQSVYMVLCQRSDRRWTALSYVVTADHKDIDLTITGRTVTPKPHTGDRGFGLFIWRTGAGAIDVSSTVCAKKPTTLSWLGAARGITSLPLPAPTEVGVAMYLINGALPPAEDKFQCGNLERQAIPWRFDSAGNPQFVFPPAPFPKHYVHSRRATWETSCGPASHRYCGVTHEESVEILPA